MSLDRSAFDAVSMLLPALVVVGVGIYLSDRELVAIGAGALGGASFIGSQR